jgi:hypothetical protein
MGVLVMVLVAYLTNGTPLPNTFYMPIDHACDDATALEYLKVIEQSLPAGHSIQAEFHYHCAPEDAIAPGPSRAAHIPQDDEA